MGSWQHLSKAPIIEGLIDFTVERSTGVSVDMLKRAGDELAADFPSREELRSQQGRIQFSPESGMTLSGSPPVPMGVILRSADQRWVVQLRLDGCTVSRLHPYTTWNDLQARAMALWHSYANVAQPQKIVRVATRFINRIPLPSGEPFDKTFSTTFSIAASLPQQVAGFLLRVAIPFEQSECLALVTQALRENTQECTFDIDVMSATPEGITESEAWSRLEQLREVKNKLFFESLSPQALEQFK